MYIRPITMDMIRPAAPQKKAASDRLSFKTALDSAMGKASAYDPIFQAAGKKWDIPPAILKAITKAESNFNPHAVSPCGAQGMMQLMPATARSLGVDDPFDPAENIFAGARYFRSMLDRFGNDPKLALAAYNAGPGSVKKYGGIPPFQETQRYVEKIMGYLGDESPAGGAAVNDPQPPVSTGQEGSFADYVRFWAEIRLAQAALVLDDDDPQISLMP